MTPAEIQKQSQAGRSLRGPLSQDFLAATLTALVISPPVLMVDSTVIRKAAIGQPFLTCLRNILGDWIRSPRTLILSPPLRLVFLVYVGTFTFANWTDTLAKRRGNASAQDKLPGLLLTSGVSTALTIYKDGRLARIFGNVAQRGKIPLSSYCLFTIRDSITIFASFALPATVAPKFSAILEGEAKQLKAAQFLLPMAVQPITTPIHLLSLDLYNRQTGVRMWDRAGRVMRDVWTATPARMFRVLPAFGVGGVINKGLRDTFVQS